MAQFPSALPIRLGPVHQPLPLAWTAKSMMLVVPPQAVTGAGLEAVRCEGPPEGELHVGVDVDPAGDPGSSGIHGAVGGALKLPGATTAATCSSSISTSAAVLSVAVTTVPLAMSVRIALPVSLRPR